MSSDPNGTRWANAESNFGKKLLKKSGWSEGNGLGKDQDGIATNVKVSRKDDVTGLGYQAGVQESWSAQSVGFADVLDRIKSRGQIVVDSSDGEDTAPSSRRKKRKTEEGVANDSGSDAEGEDIKNNTTGVKVSRHYNMYSKRNNLKTELLRSANAETDAKREEILGHASRTKRAAGGSHTHGRLGETESESTLQSPILKRLMVRYASHEPKATTDESESLVRVTKPNPRPPKCTETPFLMH